MFDGYYRAAMVNAQSKLFQNNPRRRMVTSLLPTPHRCINPSFTKSRQQVFIQ